MKSGTICSAPQNKSIDTAYERIDVVQDLAGSMYMAKFGFGWMITP